MEIIDNRGMTITVTHLQKAIQQASLFKSFWHTDARFQQSDKERQAYWADMFRKLMALQTQDGVPITEGPPASG